MVLERMLRKWGYDVVAVSDGIEALAALQATDPPRLAILDWMMPGIDGVEVCRRVREKNQEPYIYILLLTAKDSAEELVEGMEAGADDYLRKPVDSHELRVRVRIHGAAPGTRESESHYCGRCDGRSGGSKTVMPTLHEQTY